MPTPTNKCIFAPQYYGSIYYYALMASCSHAVIDLNIRYDKRFKSVHRTTIVDTRGPLTLTVPLKHRSSASVDAVGAIGDIDVSTRKSGRLWRDMEVSSHGQWWADHRVSFESAYGRTPYFEFYIDRFKPWLSDVNIPVTDFDAGLDAVIRRTLGITVQVTYNVDDIDFSEYIDCRKNIFPPMHNVPYYQIRADRLGFTPGLSIFDLLCNMGTEAPLVLDRMIH